MSLPKSDPELRHIHDLFKAHQHRDPSETDMDVAMLKRHSYISLRVIPPSDFKLVCVRDGEEYRPLCEDEWKGVQK